MKKLLFYSLFALTLLAVPSCGDDDEDEPTNTPNGMPHNPSNDTNPSNETTTIAVSGLTLDKETVTLEEGTTFTLTATVTPDNATDNTVTWTSSDAAVATVSDGKVTAVKSGEATITAKSGDKTAECKVTVKPLNLFVAKAFSVSETKQVYFSSGNLQYHCKNKEWRFAPLQYDRIGDDNANISDDYDGYIDLFGWGTGDNPTLASKSYADYATFTDWGDNIKDGNVWQSITFDEWLYLIHERENALEKYCFAEVAGVQGVIFLPDDWVLPEGVSFNCGVAFYWDEETFKTKNNYSAEDWQKMESAGAVFLPAAGFRWGTTVYYVGNHGYYWSSTVCDTESARELDFGSDDMGIGYRDRCDGFSVRLVRSL